jgi:hypothetical protein
LVKSTSHESSCYACFFTFPSLHSTTVQIFSSITCSQIPSITKLLLGW